jgi:pimeloyl-ACP methyl ester carboxylesterase
MSMGGALVQRIVIEHPERVRTIALLSTSFAASGGPELPGPSAALRDPPPEPDWADREATIDYLLEVERPYAGSRGLDEAWLRELLGRVYNRSQNMASANNHYAAEGTGEIAFERIGEIRVPALVIHGTADPLFPPAHGEALAAAIPGARLVIIEGLGHEVPRWAWDEILPALIDITAS